MLTRELLRFQLRGGKFYPLQLKPVAANLELAAMLLDFYREGAAASMRRGDLENLLQPVIRGASHPLAAAGMNKLIQDQLEFLAGGNTDYPALRDEVFRKAAAALGQCGGDYRVFRSLVPLPEAADLYGDLPEFERLHGMLDMTPDELLDRFNLAQVQGLLFYAVKASFSLGDDRPGELRRMLKYLRFFRLLAEIGKGENAGEITLEVSGPCSILGASRKYALNLCTFFPAVLRLRRWHLVAGLTISGRSGKLDLDQSSHLQSHYRNFSAYVPEEIRLFHKLFSEKAVGWKIVGDTPLFDGGAQQLIAPDLSFEEVSTGRRLHLELFHRFHAAELERRLAHLAAHPELPLMLGIDRSLADDETFSALVQRYPELASRCYRFRDFPGVENTMRVLKNFAKNESNRRACGK